MASKCQHPNGFILLMSYAYIGYTNTTNIYSKLIDITWSTRCLCLHTSICTFEPNGTESYISIVSFLNYGAFSSAITAIGTFIYVHEWYILSKNETNPTLAVLRCYTIRRCLRDNPAPDDLSWLRITKHPSGGSTNAFAWLYVDLCLRLTVCVMI